MRLWDSQGVSDPERKGAEMKGDSPAMRAAPAEQSIPRSRTVSTESADSAAIQDSEKL